MTDSAQAGRYALVTAARNEERHVERTIRSVLAQTVPPVRWVIVSDGSTDRTDEIAAAAARESPSLVFVRVDGAARRDFASKVFALRRALAEIDRGAVAFIGNLDADISLDPHYYETLLGEFKRNPKLGIAGGFVFEDAGNGFASRAFNSHSSVAGGVQFFRRECLDAIGGSYLPLPTGGEDWAAEILARMRGWEVRSFPEYKVYHHKPVPTDFGPALRTRYREGAMDYAVGSHPLFELVKCFRRMKENPLLLGGFARLSGYLTSAVRRPQRIVPPEMMEFLRQEQLGRVRGLFCRPTTA